MTECEKQVELAKAQCRIGEFFRNEMNYSDLMEMTVDAQAAIMMLKDYEDIENTGNISISSVRTFFAEAVALIKLLKPIAAIEGGL